MMDEVLEYDRFIARFSELCKKLGIPFDGDMPREKTNITKEKVIYQDHFDDETRLKVANLFQREIRLMGYEFESLK